MFHKLAIPRIYFNHETQRQKFWNARTLADVSDVLTGANGKGTITSAATLRTTTGDGYSRTDVPAPTPDVAGAV